LAELLGAELAATRKVTDAGWLPHSRQVGITGRSVRPPLYLSIGASGKINHTIGARSAGTIVAINNDAAAPIFDTADVGIVADWHDIIPRLGIVLGPSGQEHATPALRQYVAETAQS
jgi:electron transfer flavoprotein alpha subunit